MSQRSAVVSAATGLDATEISPRADPTLVSSPPMRARVTAKSTARKTELRAATSRLRK